MNKLISKITASCLTMTAMTSMLSYAGSGAAERLTFNEYMNMTDAEFIDYFNDTLIMSDLRISETGFGDDTIDDAQKFETYFMSEISDDLFIGVDECINLELWQEYVSGQTKGCVILTVDKNTPLDYSLKPSDFGFGEDWEFEVLDCPSVLDLSTDDEGNVNVIYGEDIHEYRIYPPVEVYEDFETFVRYDFATRSIDAKFRDKGVLGSNTFFERNVAGGGTPLRFGDANLDGKVTIADSAAILQYLANADKYPLTVTALRNADCYDHGSGISGMDALTIMELDADIIEALPKTK